MSRPRSKDNLITCSFELTHAQAAHIKAAAEDMGVSRSHVVRNLIQREIDMVQSDATRDDARCRWGCAHCGDYRPAWRAPTGDYFCDTCWLGLLVAPGPPPPKDAA